MFFVDKLLRLIKMKTGSLSAGYVEGPDGSLVGNIKRGKDYDSRPFARINEEFIRLGMVMAEGNQKFTMLFIILDMIISQPNQYHYSLSCENVNEVRLKYGKPDLSKFQVSRGVKLLIQDGFIIRHPRIKTNYMYDISAVMNGSLNKFLQIGRESEDSLNKKEVCTEAHVNIDNTTCEPMQPLFPKVDFSTISDDEVE